MPKTPLTAVDIDCFFESGELAVPAIYNEIDILVIYRDEYLNLEAGMVGIDNQAPYCLAKASDVDGIKQGDEIFIEDTNFIITDVRPNSESYIRLFLEVA